MNEPLAITRCELLTPLDMPQGIRTWDALCAGSRVEFPTSVNDTFLEGDAQWDRSIRLAFAVARRALHKSSPAIDDQTALFCGTSKGPVGIMLAALENLRLQKPLSQAQAQQVALGVGAIASLLAKSLSLRGPIHTSVAACASGMYALHRAAAALRRGECSRALVVAADASLYPLFESSFTRLGVLAPADANGIRHCEPFGIGGRGFFLSEGAAAIMLESNPSAPPLAWLTDTTIAGDGTGLIAVDEDTHSLRAALLQNLTASHVALPAFIHAHATGTSHDAFELQAIRAVVGGQYPAERIFSHKGQLGHSLGAAGLTSVALSVLSHHHCRTWHGIPVDPSSRSLTIAQGFGGHIAVVGLQGP